MILKREKNYHHDLIIRNLLTGNVQKLEVEVVCIMGNLVVSRKTLNEASYGQKFITWMIK